MTFIEPMACKPLTIEMFSQNSWDGYVAELKIDGMRAIITRDDDEVHIYSRTGKEYTGHLPELVGELKRVMPNHTTWDGELAYVQNYEVVYGRNVPVVSFNKTMRVMGSGEAVARAKHNALPHSIVFILFDCLRYENEPLLTTMFIERSGLTLNHSPSRLVNLVPMWDSYYADKVLDQLFESKMEGLVLKNEHGLYVPGGRPIRNQYKLKIDKTYDVVVCGYTMAKPGKFEGMIGALEFGAYHSNGDFFEVGKCSGMTDSEREWWTLMLTTERQSGHGLVIEIRSNDLVGSGDYGTPRHPQYLGIRSDKNPTDCKMEQFKL